jgi:hypothetical protein
MIYIGAHPKGIDEAMREFCTASGIAFGICTAEQKIPDSETLEQYMKRSEPAMALTDRSMFIGTSPAVAKCIAMARELRKIVYEVRFDSGKALVITHEPPPILPDVQMPMPM